MTSCSRSRPLPTSDPLGIRSAPECRADPGASSMAASSTRQAPAPALWNLLEPCSSSSSLATLAGAVHRRRARGGWLHNLPRRDAQPQGGERGAYFFNSLSFVHGLQLPPFCSDSDSGNSFGQSKWR